MYLPMATKTVLNSANDNVPFDSLSYNLRPSIKSSYVPKVLIGILENSWKMAKNSSTETDLVPFIM